MNNLDGVPVDIEAEQQLLSSLMAGPDYLFKVATEVKSQYFFLSDHGYIYNKMLTKAQSGDVIDESTLLDGEDTDRVVTIAKLYDFGITGTTAPHWAKRVKETAYAREIYKLGQALQDNAQNLDSVEASDKFLRDQTENVFNAFHTTGNDTYSPDKLGSIAEDVQAKRKNPGIHGIKTLFPIFDRVVKGLKIINLITAPSGFGKTALGIQWAWNIGIKQRIPTLYLNYEMGEDELVERLLACGSGVGLDEIQTGETTDEQNELVGMAKVALADGKLFITGCEEKTINNTVNLLYQYKAQNDIKCVFIDYIGEIGREDEEYDRNTYALYGEWLQKIKVACGNLGIKAVVLAQLNREGYKGPPGMDNVSDSMQLVHKAHVALGLYENKQHRPCLKIFKNRGGAIVQPIPLNFNKECQQIGEFV